jgi:hypothetical protein
LSFLIGSKLLVVGTLSNFFDWITVGFRND